MTRKYLLKPDQRSPGETNFRDRVEAPESLPRKADLRPLLSPVVDQGNLGSCTSNAWVSGFREYWLNKLGAVNPGLSRRFHYFHEREMEGTVSTDSGATLADGARVLLERGVCPEDLCSYDESKYAEHPTDVAEQHAAAYKIKEAHRVGSLDELKHAISLGFPVAIGIRVYSSFESQAVAQTGKVPMPNAASETFLGGHALLAVGYDDDAQTVIVRNSWGTNWGDKGYCYIPYAFISNPLLTHDMWTGTAEIRNPWDDITTEAAIKFFVDRGIFDSPDYWDNFMKTCDADPKFQYVSLAFRKIVASWPK